MNSKQILVLGLLAATLEGTAAEPQREQPMLSQAASVMDVGMAYVSNQLFQMAYSEQDSLGTREHGTRFIPQQVSAYYLKEESGKHIHIVATYRHADPGLSKEGTDKACRGMINWIRFHLGIKDNGTPIAHASPFGSSTLYQFIGASDVDVDEFGKQFAHALDAQTIVIGNVGYIGSGPGRTATCNDALVAK